MYSIRLAGLQDVEAIAAVHVACWRECYSFLPDGLQNARCMDVRRMQWLNRIKDPEGSQTLVLTDAGTIGGFSHIAINGDNAIPQAQADLHACYLLPKFRGTSAGPEMMKEMLIHAQAKGWASFCVWAWRENKIRLTYQAMGLRPVIRRNRHLCGYQIPEVGYLYTDIPEMLERLELSISRLAQRGDERQSPRRFQARLRRTA